MPSRTPNCIVGTTISRVWALSVQSMLREGVKEITPFMASVTELNGRAIDTEEEPAIRAVVDQTLKSLGMPTCQTVANTIFPLSLWNPSKSRNELFERYRAIVPHLKKTCAANQHGLYFERLISYGEGEINQLDRIIDTYLQGTHRHSALQAAILDPMHDITAQRRRGFPCLQQLAFRVDGRHLIITGFYAMQYFIDRAYGNFIGLCRLGRFMAHEMGIEFTQMNCIASVAQLGVDKQNLSYVESQLSRICDGQQGLF
jgi:hypothetical protein